MPDSPDGQHPVVARIIAAYEAYDEAGYRHCPDCGDRFPTAEFVRRHRIRRCTGTVDGPSRLLPVSRRAFETSQDALALVGLRYAA